MSPVVTKAEWLVNGEELALTHLEHAMPGVLAAEEAAEVYRSDDHWHVTRLRYDQARPVHEIDETCPCIRRTA